MQRNATANWRGSLKTGSGTVSTESGALLDAHYAFGTRFENTRGTNPEELIGAAHASCFSMALSAELQKLNLTADSIETKAEVEFGKTEEGFRVTGIRLIVSAQISGTSEEQFNKAIEATKNNCPISKLLNAPITVEHKLSSGVVQTLQQAG